MNILNLVKQLIPDHVLSTALHLVQYSAIKFIDNDSRREWVVKEMMHTLHVNESIARLAIEIAVQAAKGKDADN